MNKKKNNLSHHHHHQTVPYTVLRTIIFNEETFRRRQDRDGARKQKNWAVNRASNDRIKEKCGDFKTVIYIENPSKQSLTPILVNLLDKNCKLTENKKMFAWNDKFPTINEMIAIICAVIGCDDVIVALASRWNWVVQFNFKYYLIFIGDELLFRILCWFLHQMLSVMCIVTGLLLDGCICATIWSCRCCRLLWLNCIILWYHKWYVTTSYH